MKSHNVPIVESFFLRLPTSGRPLHLIGKEYQPIRGTRNQQGRRGDPRSSSSPHPKSPDNDGFTMVPFKNHKPRGRTPRSSNRRAPTPTHNRQENIPSEPIAMDVEYPRSPSDPGRSKNHTHPLISLLSPHPSDFPIQLSQCPTASRFISPNLAQHITHDQSVLSTEVSLPLPPPPSAFR